MNEAYGKVTQVGSPYVKTNIFHADAERDEYFSPRFYALAQTALDHNFSQGLDLSQSYGVGLGATVIQRPVEELDLAQVLAFPSFPELSQPRRQTQLLKALGAALRN